ncbi:chemotaxis-specific protein-glutamate methyltransferase CheB [Candidatus Viridilinea mediisalina]|uniref:Protein-glutamate methylesterase/protein-glutamine glutaminase n=1 Tax=Candidatus Viridilinea mediisalina TaxID=2024553 RepID=A0A2A6RHK7_9CHLR|nr:chemotaxis-specific protein-glutamate methyltransferase CheB [Candidatus Viridilinea mediisalina]PDW02330.1 chemotaxis response regulator protein-glutamate methylesterase [Candidatus Viridilinea mediisalina]
MNIPLRILVVDDSALMRRLLRDLLESDPEIHVVGEAANGREALAQVDKLRPDLITLDVRMPVMDGIETTRQLMAYHPTPILVLTASLNSYEIDITFEMLGAGALDVMEKPRMGDAAAIEDARRLLIRKVRLLSRVKVVTHLRGRRPRSAVSAAVASTSTTPPAVRPKLPPPPEPSGLLPRPARRAPSASTAPLAPRFPVVVIGASTGGPRIVRQILADLPDDFPAAIIVVQHIAQGFSGGMAEWLATNLALPVHLATEGAHLHPSEVLLVPDRYDLLLQPDATIHLSGLPLLLQRPAIDIAMQSVVTVFGAATTGVLLTGMGRDGALGMRAIQRAGGLTIAQDEATSTIFGMPRAAIELGAAALVLPAAAIGTTLRERVGVLS